LNYKGNGKNYLKLIFTTKAEKRFVRFSF